MKRPKMPQLRIPKKYRDGKLLTRVVKVLQAKFAAALEIKDPADRFDALIRLEKKIDKQQRAAKRAIYETKNKQTNAGVYASGGTGIVLMFTALAVAPPIAPFVLGAGAIVGFGGMFGTMIGQDVAMTRGQKSKKPNNNYKSMRDLETTMLGTRLAMLSIAKEHPLALVEKPRFQELCDKNPDISRALTAAFIKAQAEKPATLEPPVPDLTSALTKPRLPTPPKG